MRRGLRLLKVGVVLKFFCMAIALTCMGIVQATPLRACIPDQPNLPFSSPHGDAVGQRLVQLAVQRQGDDVEFKAAPWARCLAGVSAGEYDLLVGVEPDEALFGLIAFPRKAGKVDSSRRLGVVEYIIAKRVSLTWRIRTFSDTPKPVIVPRDIHAVSRQLAPTRVTLKEMNYDAGRFAQLLCRDRAEIIVLQRRDIGALLSGCPAAYGLQVESYPLTSTDVYLGIRKSVLQARPNLAEAIWSELAKMRETADWPSDMD